MAYPPPHHQDDDRHHQLQVIKNYPLATVISVENNSPLVTHLPLIYRGEDEKLVGHIDLYNPQTRLLKDNNKVTVIFYGPQCYISPTVYSTTQLPTWNYVLVHLEGEVEEIRNKEALMTSLIKMTEFMEAPDHRYILEPDNPRMLAALDYIKMFEITINTWEGKFKLSQDKLKTDQKLAKDELIRKNQESIRLFLDSIISIN